jgi:uncharacterized membrane protein
VIGAKADKKKKNRIWEIDFLRGICILLMVFDHTMFDLMCFPGWVDNWWDVENAFFQKATEFADFWWGWEVRVAVRIVVVFTFLLLSGIACPLSRSNGKRLGKLAAAAVLLSVATMIIDAVLQLGVLIVFGILHIMALSLGIYVLLKKLSGNKYLFLGVGLALLVAGLAVDFYNIPETDLTVKDFFGAVVGVSYLGADCYGIVPYTGVFLIGAFCGETLYWDKRTLLPALAGKWSRPVEFTGRHTLVVFLLHQPVVYAAVMLLGAAAGYKIPL